MIYIADLNDGFFNSSLYLNEYYGVTQNRDTKDYFLIMKYYKSNLRNYMIKDFYNIEWNKKLKILKRIAEGLDHIHNQKIIHRNLHSKNILCENEDDVVISDLGMSKSAMDSTDDNENYGIISYMAPEILQGKKYTIASDIYSFSMIMWELMMGKIPFWDQNLYADTDGELVFKICHGLRPLIVTNAPKGYIELMQDCWSSDPNERPIATTITHQLRDMLNHEVNYPTEIVKSPEIAPINISKPVYKSRPLSNITKAAISIRSLNSLGN